MLSLSSASEDVLPERGASLLAQGPVDCEEVQQVHVSLHTRQSQGPEA